jgi:hypothetical protein
MPRGLAERTVFVVGALLLAALAALAGLLVARSAGARGFPVDQLKQGVNAANLQITPMFVIRDRTYAIAIRPFSPGATDPVVWCPGEGFFESPVTGSKFSGVDGAYIAGPAPRGLDRYASTVVDGVLTVDPTKVDPGPPRTQAVPATKLPPCDWKTAIPAPGVVLPATPTPQSTAPSTPEAG